MSGSTSSIVKTDGSGGIDSFTPLVFITCFAFMALGVLFFHAYTKDGHATARQMAAGIMTTIMTYTAFLIIVVLALGQSGTTVAGVNFGLALPPAALAASPPPLPPLAAGQIYQRTVTVSAVVAGDVSTFDQTAYKNNMAALLPGVEADDITLNVTGASVRVVATIAAKNATVATEAASTITSLTATSLSTALGVTVESVEAP
eukprot:6657462-Prymnesium_polylepis.1